MSESKNNGGFPPPDLQSPISPALFEELRWQTKVLRAALVRATRPLCPETVVSLTAAEIERDYQRATIITMPDRAARVAVSQCVN